jgi:hypothetical protein
VLFASVDLICLFLVTRRTQCAEAIDTDLPAPLTHRLDVIRLSQFFNSQCPFTFTT